MNAQRRKLGFANSPIIIGLILAVGLGRIAMLVVAHIEAPDDLQPAGETAVTVRRAVQLVALGVQALAARFDLAIPAETGDEIIELCRADNAG